jgi:hypothetical protein
VSELLPPPLPPPAAAAVALPAEPSAADSEAAVLLLYFVLDFVPGPALPVVRYSGLELAAAGSVRRSGPAALVDQKSAAAEPAGLEVGYSAAQVAGRCLWGALLLLVKVALPCPLFLPLR